MSNLRINTENFKIECEALRSCYLDASSSWISYRAAHTYREYVKSEIDRKAFINEDYRCEVKPMSEDDFASELSVAARAAYLDGASEAQVKYLARLAFKSGERRSLGYNRLTGLDASRAINDYLKKV